MSSFTMIRLQFRALELKLGVERGGRRFWLFVFNCLASLVLWVCFSFWLHWFLGIVVGFCAFLIIKKFNVTEFWNGLRK